MRLLALLLVLPLFVAWSEHGVDTSTSPPDFLDLTDIDNLIPTAVLAYENLNYAEYEQLIHANYVFRVDPSAVDLVGANEFSAAEDLEAMNSMFSGETGLEPIIDPVSGLPTGEFAVVPPVQSIQIDLDADSASEWQEMTQGEFQGTLRRVFDLDLTISYSGNTRIDSIRGKQVIYAQAEARPGDTSGNLYWQIRGWEDQGINSGAGLPVNRTPSEGRSLGGLKANFLRSAPTPNEASSVGDLKADFLRGN